MVVNSEALGTCERLVKEKKRKVSSLDIAPLTLLDVWASDCM